MSWLTERQRDGGIDEVRVPGRDGSLWLCGKHKIGPGVEQVVGRVGADLVVCLTEEHELADRYPDYVAWLQRDSRARWFPISDLHVPPIAPFAQLVRDIDAKLMSGCQVIVHCAAGIGRAGTTACAVLIAAGCDVEEALDRVATARLGAGPQTYRQADFLEEFASLIAGAGE